MKKFYTLSILMFLSCLLNAQELLNESFEGGVVPPTSWQHVLGEGNTKGWQSMETSKYSISEAHTGSSFVEFESYNTKKGKLAYLHTPLLDLTQGKKVLTFFSVVTSGSNGLHLDVSLNAGQTWTEDVLTIEKSAAETNWTEHSLDLSAYATNRKVQVRFWASSSYGYGKCSVALDDVSGPALYVSEEPPGVCATAVPADESQNQEKSIEMSWETVPFAEGYKFYLGTDVEATNIINGQDLGKLSKFSTDVFNYSTTYYWKVVPYNSYGDASNAAVWSFVVMENPTVTSLPWSEDFEGDTFPAPGWKIIDNNGDGKTWEISTYNKNSGAKGVQTSYASTKDELLITPPIQVPNSSFLEFYAKGSSYSEYKLNIKVSETGNEYADFSANLISEKVLGGSFEKITVDLSAYQGKTIFLAFAALGKTSPYLDDVRIYVPKDMEIKTAVCSQANVSDASIGMTNTEIMKVEVNTEGKASSLDITSLKFSTEGTTDIANITGARVYYTGTTDQFSTATPFGELVSTPSGEFTVDGNQVLEEGKNCFWLAYDISEDALEGNIIDASFLELSAGEQKVSSEISQVEGNRTLKKMYRFVPGQTSCNVKTSMKFYDDGGEENNYSENFEGTVTFIPSDVNKKIQIDFSAFEIFNTSSTGYNDVFSVYNGKTKDDANLIGTFSEQPNLLKSSDASGALTIYFKVKTGNPKSGWNATVSEIVPQDMIYVSSDATHPTVGVLAAGDENSHMLRLEINTDHTLSPLSVSKINLGLGITSSVTDVAKTKVFYTGRSDQFSNGIEFGAIENPSESFNVIGEQVLKYGKNYFWVTYDIATTASDANVVDAICNSIVINDEARIPATISPEGNRLVDNTYHMPKNGIYTKKVHAPFDFTDDNQGVGEKYSKDANCTLTFEPGQSGEKVKLSFSDFRVFIQNSSYGTKAVFRVYNGREKLDENLIYESVHEDCLIGPNTPLSSSSEDGCLTVFFVGNAYTSSQTEAGWLARVESFLPAPMAYKETILNQNTEIIRPGSEDQLILECVVKTEGSLNPIESLKLTFSTEGSTSVSDIARAKLYTTGRHSQFEANTQIGDLVIEPNGAFSFDCDQNLIDGDNYFWLVYDLNSDAIPGNVVDAECTKITIGGKDHILENTAVEGNRLIKKIYEMASGSHEIVVNHLPTLFYDDGGISAKYTKAFSGTVVFVPEDENQKVRLEIPMMDIGSMEDFIIYNGGECVDAAELLKMDDDQNIDENHAAYVFKSTTEDGKLSVKFTSTQWSTPQDGWAAKVSTLIPQPIYYESSSQIQMETEAVLKSEKNANMLQLGMHFMGETSPAKVESLVFSTQGSTSVSDISSAKLYYTGNSSVFNLAGATQYGNSISNPSGDLVFSDDLTISSEDTYYFWLVYDIASNAISGNVLNATCNKVFVNGDDFVPQKAELTKGRQIKSGFHGTYTIGEFGDYPSFTSAVDAIKVGVDGPVTFKIKSGVYMEQVKLADIQGASKENTITFQSETGSADDVILIYNNYNDPGYGNPKYGVLTIEGGDFIHFKNITIKTTNKSMVALAYIRDNSTDLVFEGNKFIAPYTDSYNGVICVKTKSLNQANKNNDRLQFIDNVINGGYYGFSISGTGYVDLPKEKGHLIKGNVFENQASKALWFDNISDGVIQSNMIVNTTTTKTSFSALEIYRPKGNTIVSNNIVRMNVTQRDAKGIYLRDPIGTESNELKVVNNLVNIISSSTGAIGISASKPEFVGIYHNTVNVSGSGIAKTAFYVQYPNNEVNVRNNIFINNTQGPTVEFKSPDDIVLTHFSHNNLFTLGGVLIKAKTTELADLSVWKEMSQGTRSISEQVEFYSESDLHVKTVGKLNRGITGLLVSTDIDGEERDTEHPTIGADEYQVPSNNPPIFSESYPKILSLGHASAKLAAVVNQNGKLYFVALNKNADAPSVEQVKAGTNASDLALDEGKSGYIEIFKNKEGNFVVDKLTDHTEYDTYIVVEDNLGNCIESAVKLSFKTTYKPTEPSSFETVTEGSTNFDDGTAHFEGFSVVEGEGVEGSSQFANVSANTNATINVLNTDEGLILDGFFIRSDSNIKITGTLQDGSQTPSVNVLNEEGWTYVDLRVLGKVVAVNFIANTSGFDIDNFSGLPLPLNLDLPDELSLTEGESLQLVANISGGVKPYQYQWSPTNSLSGADLASPEVSPVTTTKYTLKVTGKFGAEVSEHVLVNVTSSLSKTADFEEIALESEHYLMGDSEQQSSFFYSGSYQFNNFYAPSYMTWSGFGISKETSTNFKPAEFLKHQFRNVVGGGLNREGNYAVVYAYGYVPEITLNNGLEEDEVKGMYITNNAYTLNSLENGDSFVGGEFTQGDYYMVTATGYDKTNNKTQSIDIYLADYRSTNTKEHFIVKDWKWIDLSALGKVKTVRFTVSGSRNNNMGLTTPAYFCIDNFNSDKIEFAPNIKDAIPDVEVDEDAEDTVIDLTSLFTDSDNEDELITMKLVSSVNSKLLSASISDNKLTIAYKANQSGSEQISIKASSNGKTVTSSFNVVVNPVDDAPIVEQEVVNKVVDVNAPDESIDLSSVFFDIDDEFLEYSVEVDNDQLVAVSIDGNYLNIHYQANQAGEVNVTLKAEANNQSVETSFTIVVNFTTGIEDLEQKGLSIYPNPCQDYFWLEMGDYEGMLNVSIISLTGRVVKTNKLQYISRERIDMTGLQTGMYIIRLQTSEGSFVKKILKN